MSDPVELGQPLNRGDGRLGSDRDQDPVGVELLSVDQDRPLVDELRLAAHRLEALP